MQERRGERGSLYTPGGQRKYLTADERRRFIAAARGDARDDLCTLCLTLAYTGCRISEAVALVASSIEVDDGFIAIRSLKKRTRAAVMREVPIPPDLVRVLGEVHGLNESHPGKKLWALSRSQAWRLVKRVMDRAGIAPGPHRTAKGLRHGFGVHAVRSGVPINLVQRWLGHASLSTTTIYLQVMGDEERAIAARMWASNDPLSLGR
ncbi:MAG: site-specific integrase [Pseudolabrys sp.]|nr:site-specific integrase [Pseudolabrys sp.]MCW5696138.1 site-specific integrase [Bauldia sp.]